MRAFWLLFMLTACSLNVDYRGTYFQCNPDGSCPPDFQCVDMVCVPTDPVPPACSSEISAGGFHTCAVREDHTVWCWGRNDSGQLGDGTATDTDLPVQVTMLENVKKVGAGELFTCALDDKGLVWCWGNNRSGQLGTTSDSRTPVQVNGISGATQLSVGYEHACVLNGDGSVACWGNNTDGQLGDGSMNDRNAPITVPGLDGVRSVATGQDRTCAVLNDGTAQCWGENNDGELGVGDTMPHTRPTLVVDVPNIVEAAPGDDHTCFRTTEGFVYCSGLNDNGQLGNGNLTNSSRPQLTLLAVGAVAIGAGAYHTCALDGLGQTWCWGYGGDGRLLDAGYSHRVIPVRGLVEHVVTLSAGYEHTCVLDTEGAIRCAGFNRRGQLGDGRRITSGAPVEVPGVENAVALVAGARHTCAAQQDGQVLCWGQNDEGESGNGSFTEAQTIPHPVYGIAHPKSMAAGDEHTCVLLEDNGTYCWGFNGGGRLGDGTTTNSAQPRPVKDLLGTPTRLAVGDFASFAMISGGARCWGQGFGLTPTTITNVSDIAAGYGHVCTLEPDKTVLCYGDNLRGQLGDNTQIARGAPGVQAIGVTNAVEVKARGEQSCARIGDGTIKCWGLNESGRLGVGNTIYNQPMPAIVMGLSNVMKFAMGYLSSCAIKSDGTLWCWGANYYGDAGDGSYQTRPAAVQIVGLTGVKDVASGLGHSCAIDSTGHVWCWGLSNVGQLGTGIREITKPVGVRMSCPE